MPHPEHRPAFRLLHQLPRCSSFHQVLLLSSQGEAVRQGREILWEDTGEREGANTEQFRRRVEVASLEGLRAAVPGVWRATCTGPGLLPVTGSL